MIPFRGYPFSYSGKDRHNIPSVPTTQPEQPTPPAFNIPSPVEVPPSTAAPVAPTTPTTEVPFVPPIMPVSQPMPPVMPISQPVPMMSMPCMPQMPFVPPVLPACPYMANQMMPEMYNMNYMDMDELMDISMSPPNTDPPPVLSNNPVTSTITLFKELTGYPNYGNPSGNADILYTGNRGTWTFDVPQPQILPGLGNQRGQLTISAVLDDHNNVPIRQYSLRISVNGTIVHNGPVRLPHGAPAGTVFNNWVPLTFNITNLRRNNRIVIVNTSTAGPNDWIAFDWMELRLVPR